MATPHPGQGNGSALLERSRRVREDAANLRRSLGDLIGDGEARLTEELERRPYVTLSLATGAGYVLGGGLPPRLTRWALGVGGRLFLASILRDLLTPNAERRVS